MKVWFRNSIDVVSNEGVSVDRGSLWKRSEDILTLEDEDLYATHELTDSFEEA